MTRALHAKAPSRCISALTCSAKRVIAAAQPSCMSAMEMPGKKRHILLRKGKHCMRPRNAQSGKGGLYLAQPFGSEVAAGGLKGNCQPCCCVLMQARNCLGQLHCNTQLGHGLHSPAAPLAEPQRVGVFPILLSIPAWSGASVCLPCLSLDRDSLHPVSAMAGSLSASIACQSMQQLLHSTAIMAGCLHCPWGWQEKLGLLPVTCIGPVQAAV